MPYHGIVIITIKYAMHYTAQGLKCREYPGTEAAGSLSTDSTPYKL